MTVQYIQLQYEEYKELERQMREFKETTHKSEVGFYHKAIRLRISSDLTMEFHGPLVMAGQAAAPEPEKQHAALLPAGGQPAVPTSPEVVQGESGVCAALPEGHDWERREEGGWRCLRCGQVKSGGG